MEKILEIGNKYKYEIISVIVIGIIYVLFTIYSLLFMMYDDCLDKKARQSMRKKSTRMNAYHPRI